MPWITTKETRIQINYAQKSVLMCIENFYAQNNKMPTSVEIAKSLNMKVNTVLVRLSRLEVLGLIKREFAKPRSIELCYEGSVLDHSNVTDKDR